MKDMCTRAYLKVQSFLCIFALLSLVSSCADMGIQKSFLQGAKLQDGLDAEVVYLWERSPAENSNSLSILSDENLDVKVTKIPLILNNILDKKSSLKSRDVHIRYSDYDMKAPLFYRWAGSHVPWMKDRPDFRAFFAYYHANRFVSYVDRLIARGYLPPDSPTGSVGSKDTIAWRTASCSSGSSQDNGRTCASAGQIVGGPVVPFHISVDNDRHHDGSASLAKDTGYCSLYNENSRENSEPFCLSRDKNSNWNTLWHNKQLVRMVSFYSDKKATNFNLVDDADVVLHELAHVLQAAMNPVLLETSVGLNPHLDAIIEGMADYFSATFLRTDQIFRYSTYNFYPLYPDSYVGDLRGSERDVGNMLYFPDAYLGSSRSLGRVLAGAFNDIRKLALNIEGSSGVDRLPGGSCAKTQGCAVADFSDRGTPIPHGSLKLSEADAWDLSMALFFRTFHALRSPSFIHAGLTITTEEAENITLHRFAELATLLCAQWSACSHSFGEANVRKIFIDRGLISTRATNPQVTQAEQDVTLNTVQHLVQMGIESHVDDNIQRRWGINLSNRLAWLPYRPDGTDDFANNDSIPSPCEVVVVFPHIANNSNLGTWGTDAPAPPATWPNLAAAVAGWSTDYNLLNRGADLIDIEYKIVETPLGFENFQHPTLGYIEPWPWQGVEKVATKRIPYLQAGETSESLARGASSRIYKNYQENNFDTAVEKKTITPQASQASLRSKVGYIMQLPDEDATKAFLTFELKYGIANTKKQHKESLVHFIDHNVDANTRSVAKAPYFQQSITTQAVSTRNFCDN